MEGNRKGKRWISRYSPQLYSPLFQMIIKVVELCSKKVSTAASPFSINTQYSTAAVSLLQLNRMSAHWAPPQFVSMHNWVISISSRTTIVFFFHFHQPLTKATTPLRCCVQSIFGRDSRRNLKRIEFDPP